MIEKKIKMYYCQFCSGRKRKKSQRRHIVARHETICFANPDRTPMPGEVTQLWQTGRDDFDFETGAYDFVPHAEMPKWWPGVGMIYTGSKWMPVEGYVAKDDTWPQFEGVELPKIKPWARRLVVLGIEDEDMPEEVQRVIDPYRPEAQWY